MKMASHSIVVVASHDPRVLCVCPTIFEISGGSLTPLDSNDIEGTSSQSVMNDDQSQPTDAQPDQVAETNSSPAVPDSLGVVAQFLPVGLWQGVSELTRGSPISCILLMLFFAVGIAAHTGILVSIATVDQPEELFRRVLILSLINFVSVVAKGCSLGRGLILATNRLLQVRFSREKKTDDVEAQANGFSSFKNTTNRKPFHLCLQSRSATACQLRTFSTCLARMWT